MSIKSKTLTLSASTALAVLLTALFIPVFWAILPWGVLTLSVWEYSFVVALSGAVAFSAFILMPLIKPGTSAWLFPFSLGLGLLVAVLCAAVYSFPTASDLSNFLFHPYGLILFAVGSLLCIAEGWHARSLSRPSRAA